jgi:hypothetical protein
VYNRLLGSQLCTVSLIFGSAERWPELTLYRLPCVQVDQVGNLAAFATIDDTGDIQYTTFSEQPHPVRFLDAFRIGQADLTLPSQLAAYSSHGPSLFALTSFPSADFCLPML